MCLVSLKVTVFFKEKKWQNETLKNSQDLSSSHLVARPDDTKMCLFPILLGLATQQFPRGFIAGIAPATFGNHRTEEWHLDCAQRGGIRRYFNLQDSTISNYLENYSGMASLLQ